MNYEKPEKPCKRKYQYRSNGSREAHADRMRKMHSDPAFNPLAALTREQRDEYDILVKKGGYKRAEALSMLTASVTI